MCSKGKTSFSGLRSATVWLSQDSALHYTRPMGDAQRRTTRRRRSPRSTSIHFLPQWMAAGAFRPIAKIKRCFRRAIRLDAAFYLQEGKVKVCVVNELGKEAVVAIHNNGDFFRRGLP